VDCVEGKRGLYGWVMKPLLMLLLLALARPCAGSELIESWETLKKEHAIFLEKARRVRGAAKSKANSMRDFESRWYETMFDDAADPHRMVKIEHRPRAALGAEFDAVWEEFQKEREKFAPRIKALFERAVSEEAERVAKLIREAKGPEEFEVEIARMEELLRWPYPDPSKSQVTVADELREYRRLLEECVAIFKAGTNASDSTLGNLLGKLKRTRVRSDVVKQAIEIRVDQHGSVLDAGTKKAVAEFLELARKDEPSEKIREGWRRLLAVEGAAKELGRNLEGEKDDISKVRVQASEWSRAKEREEKGEIDGAKWLYGELAKGGPHTALGKMAEEKVRKLEGKADAMRQEVEARRDATVTEILDGVKDVATAEAALARIEQLKDGRYRDVTFQLRNVSDAWRDPQNIRGFRLRAAPSTAAIPCGLPLLRVYERAQRHVAARRIPEPALEQPPLSGQTIEEAFGTIEKQYRAQGDWLKLFELQRLRIHDPEAPELAAIQSYLTAQRFEKANDLREAVARYRAVLEVVSERTPHQEATERLKILREKHPEVFENPPPKN
jgi:hypothetical protein